MKPIHQRIIAILLLCIPGIFGIWGWTIMRDIIFDAFAGQGFAWLPFIGGVTLLVMSLAFLGGFIYHRDRKRNYIHPRKKRREISNQ